MNSYDLPRYFCYVHIREVKYIIAKSAFVPLKFVRCNWQRYTSSTGAVNLQVITPRLDAL